jgi:hypothetical protein
MTIDRSWIEGFKCIKPEAFSDVPPYDVQIVLIDCQLCLQCPQSIDTWDLFFECLFQRPINRYLDYPAVETLVLA